MSFRTLTRGLALLMLLVSVNARATSQGDVLIAIQHKTAAASSMLALYAADRNTTVAEVVRSLVSASPRSAGYITAAAVKANASKTGDIVTAAMQALVNNPRVLPSELPKLRLDIIMNAAANAPGRVADIRAAALAAGVPSADVEKAIAAGLAAAANPNTQSRITTFVGDIGSGGVASP